MHQCRTCGFIALLFVVGCGRTESTTVGSPEAIQKYLDDNQDLVKQQREIIARRNAAPDDDD